MSNPELSHDTTSESYAELNKRQNEIIETQRKKLEAQDIEILALTQELSFYRDYYPRAHKLYWAIHQLMSEIPLIPSPPSQERIKAEWLEMSDALRQIASVTARFREDCPF